MDVAQLQDLIVRAIAGREVVVREAGGHMIRVVPVGVSPATDPRPEPVVASRDDAVRAPCFGIVHLTPSPGAPPFVRAGDVVAAGQRVCLVEAMKVFHPVTAPVAGRVSRILVAAGDEVARGQWLLRVDAIDDGG
jgi:acetyl-CoA carboxylase biotin carboxyl carrier protein